MILDGLGDEVRGARIICFYRRRGREYIVLLSGRHRGKRTVIAGEPARAIIEKPLRARR